MQELEMIVSHLIEREYSQEIDSSLTMPEKVLLLAHAFRNRLTLLVANWIRVGYCQGNFNSDNCAAGGFTLDYGPFGFMELFNPEYQPWTGGGKHFSFFNQPRAAHENFTQFCSALQPLLESDEKALQKLEEIRNDFSALIQQEMEKLWASKLGLDSYDATLLKELFDLMMKTYVDYTLFFRELSNIPKNIEALRNSFYGNLSEDKVLEKRWSEWLEKWKALINVTSTKSIETLSQRMKSINPKYTLREWHLVPAYQQAKMGDYSLIKELQDVMTKPYEEQSKEVEEKYYTLKPTELFNISGISHISCSS